MATIVVFDTFDNIATVLITQKGIAVDFTGFTRFTLEAGGVVIDTDLDVNTITTTATQGELQFDIGGKGIPIGDHKATLIWFDASHINGQVLACDGDNDLTVQVKICS